MPARTAALAALLFPALLAAPAVAQRGGQGCSAVNLLYDENEDVAEKHVDTNKDCVYDQFIYYLDGKPEKAEVDSNFDGRLDTWTYYEQDGKTLARQEFDIDGDGQKDRWIQHRGGQPATQLDDKNADGRPDSTLSYQNGQPHRLKDDTDFDGKTDRWVEYAGGQPSVIADDTDKDGTPGNDVDLTNIIKNGAAQYGGSPLMTPWPTLSDTDVALARQTFEKMMNLQRAQSWYNASMVEKQKTETDDGQRRDALLLKLLKTPPQPRPKRERSPVEKSTKRKPRKQQSSDE